MSTRINILYLNLVTSGLKQRSRTPKYQSKTRKSISSGLPLRRTLRNTTDTWFKIPIYFSPTLVSGKQLSLIWTVSVTIATVFIIFDDQASLTCAFFPILYRVVVCQRSFSHCPLASCPWRLSFPRFSSVNETAAPQRSERVLWQFLLWIFGKRQISAGIKILGEVSSTSKSWGWRQAAGLNR